MALDILSGILVNESPVLHSLTIVQKEELNKNEPISDPIKKAFFFFWFFCTVFIMTNSILGCFK